jgi:hypothetical protein
MKKQATKRKIYIDLGAHNGSSILAFLGLQENRFSPYFEYPRFDGAPDFLANHSEWEIYGFEVSDWHDLPLKAIGNIVPNFQHIKKVAHVENCMVNFSCDDKGGQGYALTEFVGEKYAVKQKEAIDFVEWFKNLTGNDDVWVCLKVDIEGSEYPILEKMILSGEILKVDELLIEFHYQNRHPYREKSKAIRGILNNLKTLKNFRTDWP